MIQAFIIAALLSGGPYVSVGVGTGYLENHEFHGVEFTYDNGQALSGAMGYDFGFFRTEAEHLWLSNDIDKIWSLDKTNHVNSSEKRREDFWFLNGIFDIPITEKLEGYAGGGYGFPEWQLMAGLRLHLTRRWDLSLGYRYIDIPYDPRPRVPLCCGPSSTQQTGGYALQQTYQNHLAVVGLSFNF